MMRHYCVCIALMAQDKGLYLFKPIIWDKMRIQGKQRRLEGWTVIATRRKWSFEDMTVQLRAELGAFAKPAAIISAFLVVPQNVIKHQTQFVSGI
jgi:hypothetical protein